MNKDQLIERLMATFLGELDEYVRTLNRDLLALENTAAGADTAEILKSLFRTAHSLKGAARAVEIKPLEDAAHCLEEILSAARARSSSMDARLLDLLFAAADAIEETGKRLREGRDLSGIALETVIPALQAVCEGKSLLELQLPKRDPAAFSPAPAEKPEAPPTHEALLGVSAARLDTLIRQSGELTMARSRLAAHEQQVAALLDVAREHATRQIENDLELLAARMAIDHHAVHQAAVVVEEGLRELRMVPFSRLCEGLDRIVRDLARDSGKEADLFVEGGHVELDRAVLDALRSPLVQIIRNAIDHGIERPEERRSSGKPSRARITVSAALRGSRVEVQVADDGRGLDLEAIRKRAEEQGIPLPSDESLIARMIFLPAFSTSRTPTSISGRGVGLDIVRSRIEALNGEVRVMFSAGSGTTFVLAVPLTLTTIRALLVRSAGEMYAIDAACVARLQRVASGDVHVAEGRTLITIDGVPIPIVHLNEALGWPAGDPEPASMLLVVVLEVAQQRVAVVVDALIAEQELVVKNLGQRLIRVRNISGATFLPDGRIALILNASDLIASVLEGAAHIPLLAPSRAEELRRRVLVVDDSITTRTLEKSILEAAGFDVVSAADGEEAWRLLQERSVDLVVTDIEMPRMDGLDLTRAIRASRRLRTLPVILVSALDRQEDRERGIEAGADAYLVKKTFDQRSLLETIARLL